MSHTEVDNGPELTDPQDCSLLTFAPEFLIAKIEDSPRVPLAEGGLVPAHTKQCCALKNIGQCSCTRERTVTLGSTCGVTLLVMRGFGGLGGKAAIDYTPGNGSMISKHWCSDHASQCLILIWQMD